MVNVLQAVKGEKEIAACIFVVKFQARIDQQYRKTIKYYSHLLRFLFEKNLVIVMTDYCSADHDGNDLRKKALIDVDKIVQNTEAEIRETVGLSYNNNYSIV